MPRPVTDLGVKYCEVCGKPIERKRYANSLEDRKHFENRRYCSLQCAGVAHRKAIPTKSAIGKRLIQERKSCCAVCGADAGLQVHHLDGNRLNNSSENLLTVCASCHTKWHWKHGKSTKRKRQACVICGAESHAKNMCQKHWLRFKKYSDPLMKKVKIGKGLVLTRVDS